VQRGELWWGDLPEPVGAGSGYRRPVVIIQADAFSASRIATVIVAAVTASRRLAAAPGNVWLPRGSCGLDRDSAINVTQLLTIDKRLLLERIGCLAGRKLRELDDGLRQVLAL
jgi:mRNA interferase MazF